MLIRQFVQFAFIWPSLPTSDEITQSWPDYSHHDCSVFLCTGCKGYRSLNRLYTTCMRSSVTFIVLWNPTPNKNSIVRTLPSDTLIMGQSNPPSLNHIDRSKRSRKKEEKGEGGINRKEGNGQCKRVISAWCQFGQPTNNLSNKRETTREEKERVSESIKLLMYLPLHKKNHRQERVEKHKEKREKQKSRTNAQESITLITQKFVYCSWWLS